MKYFSILLSTALLAFAACETTSPPKSTARASDRQITRDHAYAPGGATQQIAPPDAQVIYQNTTSGPHVRSTSSGVYQQRGAVTEEIHIGNQRLFPGQSPSTFYRGNLQPGFVPSGTTGIYDPATGRTIPVRR